VAVGELVTAVFEDRKTVLFQIQEMLRAEGIERREAIDHEIATYNGLVPGEDELSATLLVNLPERERVREALDRLVGLHEHVALRVAGHAPVRAVFDEMQLGPQRISAVQYVKLPLGAAVAAAFGDAAVPAALVIDHPAYQAEAALEGAVRASLMKDLQTS
jgi:hypothetical protein